MAQLDKFKRRLIRSVARLRVDEKKPDKEVWEILNKEMGCDCGPLWDRMRALTLKKLSRLLVFGDRTEHIASVARPSDTDMLMFDLVLAHEDDVDVIGRDLIFEKRVECKVLEELFELVQEFSLEETPVHKLADTWAEAVQYYNNKGDRLTSLMLLQRRWYQLKELTRLNFYQLWNDYRGNAQFWDKARTDCSLTDLQVAIAERYPYIVTKPFKKWEELIKDGVIVLPHHFETKVPEKTDSGASGNEQDLVLVEPEVETIDLRLESDSDPDEHGHGDCTGRRQEDGNTAVEFDPNITIKAEPPDTDGLSNVKILEATHIPIENSDIDPRIALKNDLLRNISKCIESTDELIKQCDPEENQSENVQNALNDVEDQMENINEPQTSVEMVEDESQSEPEPEHSQGKNVDYFREKIVEEMSKACGDEDTESNQEVNNFAKSKENASSPDTPHDRRSSEEEEEVLEDIIKQTADDFVSKSKESRAESSGLTLTELTIVDEGIDFVDDGIEYQDDEDKNMDEDDDSRNKNEEETPSIDLKLLMTPQVVTTRLDEMLAFRNKEFDIVTGKSTIDLAELESKPKQIVTAPLQIEEENNDSVISRSTIDLAESESTPKEIVTAPLEVVKENNLPASESKPAQIIPGPTDVNEENNKSESDNDESEDDSISEDQRIKPTSYLLQKPRSRSYNPIQLCKNPDFNTRLKRLTFGFLSSQRNRKFLSECKPATIDLHKGFEDKLVNGTLYLKRTDRTGLHQEKKKCIRTSVGSSTMSVQSFIDRSIMNLITPNSSSTASSIDLTSDDLTERNKVIHLPDISQVRRINQKLLTAEVPPIRVQNDVTTYRTADPMLTAVKNIGIADASKETVDIIQKPDNFSTRSQQEDKTNAPLLSQMLVTHKAPSFGRSFPKSGPTPGKGTTNIGPKKGIGRPSSSHDKCVTKPKAKPPPYSIQNPRLSYYSLPWNKPAKNLPLNDYLLAHDTLLKIIAKAKNLPEYTYTTAQGKKNVNINKAFKKSENDEKNSKTAVKSKTKKTKALEVIETTNINKETQQTHTPNIQAVDITKESIKEKPAKTRARKGIMKTICCWARAYIYKENKQLLRLPRHMCPYTSCNCCCKNELPTFPPKSNITQDNNEPIELSDEETDKFLTKSLTSITKTIESVVQQSTQVPVPKLRVYSSINKNDRSNSAPKDVTSQENIVIEDDISHSSFENAVEYSFQDVICDSPVANVQGEVSVVADDIEKHSSENNEISIQKPTGIRVISEAKESNLSSKGKQLTYQVINSNTSQMKLSQDLHGLNTQVPPLVPSSVSSKMYVKAIFKNLTQKSPSVTMSTQTMDVPLLQNHEIDSLTSPVKSPVSSPTSPIKSDRDTNVIRQKQLLIDGTGTCSTPTTLINKQELKMVMNVSKLPSDNPIYLGKNKILLTTVKFPADFDSPKKDIERKENVQNPKVIPTFPLPEGVEFVLQPNGELGCVMKPGVELDSEQLAVIPSILAAVKQQINTKQPFLLSDVITLSDDEKEQTNEENQNASESTVVTSVKHNQNPGIVPEEQLGAEANKNETNNTDDQKICQEQSKEAELLIHKSSDMDLSEPCDASTETRAKETEENVSENKNDETNICQIQAGQTDLSQPTVLEQPQARVDLNQSDKDKDQSIIENHKTLTESKKCDEESLDVSKIAETPNLDNKRINEESDKINTEKSIEESEVKSTEHQKDTSSSGNRNLLSDLMEMSGISEEDIKAASEPSTSVAPNAVMNVDPNCALSSDNASLANLTPVTSLAQLKYACEQNGKFFKLDFDTGSIVPISVCIQKKKLTRSEPRRETVEFSVQEGGPIKYKVPISSTPPILAQNIKPILAQNSRHRRRLIASSLLGNESLPVSREDLGHTYAVAKSGLEEETRKPINYKFKEYISPVFSKKPITILRHTRKQHSLLRHPVITTIRVSKRARKETRERIEAKIDLLDSDAPMEEEYLINSESDDDDNMTAKVPQDRIAYRKLAKTNIVTEASDDSSDDEPLAMKSQRMRAGAPPQAVAATEKNADGDPEDAVWEFLRKKEQPPANEDVEMEVPVSVIKTGPVVMNQSEPTDADSMEMDADSMEIDTDMPATAILEEPNMVEAGDDAANADSAPEESILGM